ncbi:uncharacterized protein KY384_000462 [Bacidia gigantensis]|uniref:uncharacterized protein n=1 Tax=Bacidia gigantensis TaxID=2732470 RepID=UPI001D057414|nr:uncharacterized protein KY384_000462 [Bacidia gigantensis]KAG8525702.1 hypothetical protein KY384_000462 [Bacidia gigantensis]
MGMSESMKRKFSFTNLTRLKTAQPAEDPRHDYDLESPPYSPTTSEMERPKLPPHLLHDLKESCTILVTLTNPPDPDDEPDHEMIRRIEAERKARHAHKRAVEAQAMKADLRQVKLEEVKPKLVQTNSKKEQPRRYSTRRPRQDSKDAATNAAPQHYVPKDPMGRHKSSDAQPISPEPSHAIVSEPVLPPVHAPIVERIREQQQKLARRQAEETKRRQQREEEFSRRKKAENHVLGHIRSSMHMRPKTSAAATIDYEGDPMTFSSNSTSRSNSDYANLHQATSTGLTSLQAQSPSLNDGRSSANDRRPSDNNSVSDSMKEIHKLARQRADEYTANKERYSRPASRQSKLSRMTSASDLGSKRPSSRAGSLASSIASGIHHYIRPRASNPGSEQGSIRSGRSSSLGFSSRSRSSSMSRRSSFSNGGWWRNGGLRRRGSWASFRSGGGEAKERNKLRKDGGPNLNRPLPALPGLDQYKETKTHIGQLVKKKKIKKSKIGEPQPYMPADAPYICTAPPYCRSNSDLGYYTVSAPLLDAEGKEMEFPRYDKNEQPERRSTHPEATVLTKAEGGKDSKLRRSSLNPIKPRRGSITADKSENDEQQRKLPPPMIRGPSYKKELANGVYPRRMEVNDGGSSHVVFYDQSTNQTVTTLPQATGDGKADAPCQPGKKKSKGKLGKMLGAGKDGRRAVAAN